MVYFVFNIILTVVFLFFCFPVFDPVALYFPTGNRCWSAGLHKIPRGTKGVTVLFCVSTLQLNHQDRDYRNLFLLTNTFHRLFTSYYQNFFLQASNSTSFICTCFRYFSHTSLFPLFWLQCFPLCFQVIFSSCFHFLSISLSHNGLIVMVYYHSAPGKYIKTLTTRQDQDDRPRVRNQMHVGSVCRFHMGPCQLHISLQALGNHMVTSLSLTLSLSFPQLDEELRQNLKVNMQQKYQQPGEESVTQAVDRLQQEV